MKKTLILFLGLWPLFVQANTDYKITLKSGEELNCTPTKEKIRLYHCAQGDKFALVSPAGAIGNLKSNELSLLEVKDVFNPQGEKITDKVFMFPGLDMSMVRRDEVSWLNYLQGLTILLPFESEPPTEQYLKIKQQFNSLVADENKRISKILDADEHEIILQGQQQDVQCKRLRPIADPVIKAQFEKVFGSEMKCGISKCADGKHLFKSPFAGSLPEVASFDKQGNWKFETFKKLKAKGADRPLMDYSFFEGLSAYGSGAGIAGGAGGGFGYDGSDGSGAGIYKGAKPSMLPEISWEHYIPKEFRNNALFTRQALNMGSSYLEGLAQFCDERDVAEIIEALKTYQDRLAKTEMVQYITEVNEVLTGHFISPDKIPELACDEDGVYVRRDLKEKARSLKPKGPAKTITLDEAKKLFRKAQEMKDIAWGYKMDGCYARAHLMARRFEKMGHTVDKAWIKGNLEVETNDSKIQWNFHVAPVVYVRDKGKVLPYVIDPSIMSEPVPAEVWAAKMTKNLPGGVVKTQYPFPVNASMYKRAALAFSGPSPYLPNDTFSMTEKEKMSLAIETMKEYKGYEK